MVPTASRAAQANPLRELFEHRRRLGERRTALAMETAGPMVDALVAAAPGWSDDALEDDFCVRFGAAAVLHLRDFYNDDFATELVAVLPEWIRFLAEHTGMTAEQTERCLAYASGELQFPGMLYQRGDSHPMARVTE